MKILLHVAIPDVFQDWLTAQHLEQLVESNAQKQREDVMEQLERELATARGWKEGQRP